MIDCRLWAQEQDLSNYPTTVSQYVELGKLLASCLEIPVLRLKKGDSKSYGPGWSHDGSHYFGVTNGNFLSADHAYADLAARCLDSCSATGARYDGHVTEEGRKLILSAVKALSHIEGIKSGVQV
jgi:hypothetical protein